MIALVPLRMRTKIRLSPEELKLALNADILLTKNRVMQKACEYFSQLAEEAGQAFGGPEGEESSYGWNAFVDGHGPKISRGEQYKGLPYVMLDHPRKFSREHVFAIRNMFWWGHYFIQTLHLKGVHQHKALEWMPGRMEGLREAGFQVSATGEEWIHDFEEKNYLPMDTLPDETIWKKLRADPFVKIAAMIPMNDWDEAMEKMLRNYRLLLP